MNEIKLEDIYRPDKEVQEFTFDVYSKFFKWRALREQPYKQFNQQNLTDWLNEGRQKFWGYLPLSFDVDTPQFFFPETRNQIIGILSKVANLKMKPSFEGVEGFDIIKATILKDLFELWRRSANRKINNFWQFLYNVINGTAIVFTAYKSNKRTVSNIKYYDPETGKTEYEESEVDDSDVEDVVCNLEDIYIPKLWEPNIQKQNELIWRTLVKLDDFKIEFGKYPMSKFVMPGSQFSDSSIFSDFISYDVKGTDFVEVVKYFNVAKDQYAIIANGVLINPVKNKRKISPLPWNHKILPFSKTIFEPLDANFFYGMSLPQKVKSPQDALNKMWELMMEREIRAVAAPIITNDPSVEFGLEFKPGRVYQVQADPSAYKEIQMAPTSGSFWNALNTLQGVISKTGTGGLGSILPSVQPRSATENNQQAQEKKEASGLYFLFYQDLLEQKSWLTIMNMIQFYTADKTEKAMGDKKFNKILSLTDTKLFGGGIGNRELRITNTPSDAKDLKEEAYLRSVMKKEKVEIIEVSPEALRDLSFDIKINFEMENSPEAERALYLDYIMTVTKLFGQTGLLSQKKMLYRTVEKFGESIGDVVEDNVMFEYENEMFGAKNPQPAQPGQEQPPTPGEMPAVNDFNQSMRGQQFGAQGGIQNTEGGNIIQKF